MGIPLLSLFDVLHLALLCMIWYWVANSMRERDKILAEILVRLKMLPPPEKQDALVAVHVSSDSSHAPD